MARSMKWVLYAEPILGVLALSVALSTFSAVSRIAEHAPNDFTVFLESARWLRQGADLYQHPLREGPGYNLNTPAAVLVFVPLSFLGDAAALRIWTILAFAAYALSAFLIAREVAPGRTVTIAAAVLLSQPAITSLLLGQTGAVLMLLVTAAWVADRRDRPWLAGLLVGVAIGAKPFLIVMAAYAMWRRSSRLAIGMAAGVAAATIAGLVAAGAAGLRSWIGALGQISWSAHVANGSLHGLFTRTLSETPAILHATPIAIRPELVQPLWWIGVAIVAAVAIRTLAATRDVDRAWAVLLAASLIVSPLGWVYYAAIFTGPLIAAAQRATPGARGILALGYVCLLVPPLTVTTSSAIAIVVLGSIYAWGLLLVFAGLAIDPRPSVSESVLPRGQPTVNVASPP